MRIEAHLGEDVAGVERREERRGEVAGQAEVRHHERHHGVYREPRHLEGHHRADHHPVQLAAVAEGVGPGGRQRLGRTTRYGGRHPCSEGRATAATSAARSYDPVG